MNLDTCAQTTTHDYRGHSRWRCWLIAGLDRDTSTPPGSDAQRRHRGVCVRASLRRLATGCDASGIDKGARALLPARRSVGRSIDDALADRPTRKSQLRKARKTGATREEIGWMELIASAWRAGVPALLCWGPRDVLHRYLLTPSNFHCVLKSGASGCLIKLARISSTGMGPSLRIASWNC